MNKSLFFLFLTMISAGATGGDAGVTDEKGFIRDWLTGGAYPNYQVNGKQQGYEDDFLIKLGGETQAEPYDGLRDTATFKADKAKLIAGIGSANEWGYTADKTLPVIWRKIHRTGPKAEIVLDKMFLPVDDYLVTYAFCYIESPIARKIKVRLGSDDDHKVWLNGRLLGGVNQSQGVIPDNFIYNAELQRGLNRLLLKIVDRTHGYGFCLALSDTANQPLHDVKIILDDPRRKLLNTISGLRRVDSWDNGFYAGFDFSGPDVFKGSNRLLLQAGAPRPGKYKILFTVTGNNRTIVREEKNIELKSGELLNWQLCPVLPAGQVVMTIKVSGDGDAELVRRLEVFDPEELRKDNAKLAATLTALKQKLPAVQHEKQQNQTAIRQLEQQREKLYAAIETAYLERRKKLKSSPAPIDETPPPSSTVRNRLCLNGDQWQMAVGNGQAAPAENKWEPATLPMNGFNEYFRTWYYPVRNVDPKNRYGQVEPLPGWETFKFNPLICKTRVWFRHEIEFDSTAAGKFHTLIGECVNGKLKVYLNGKLCGEYFGNIGAMEMPLTGARPGKNRLELYLESPEAAGLPPSHFSNIWGIRGDLWLESTAAVRVADSAVKTCWRNGSLTTTAELENHNAAPAEIRFEQYCVLDNRIKYRFPPQSVTLAAGSRKRLINRGVWLEAENWGIGGQYGRPVLYDLVSDVYADGKLIDRRITPFGFREFWIAGTDFYLNGKRLILQGDVGLGGMDNVKLNEVAFPLLRADGINTLRNHDSDYWSANFLRSCDKMGMLAYVNMYPILHEKKQPGNFAADKPKYLSCEEWLKHPLHQYNLRNYERWVKMLRHHPSVVIASTDNEIFTQAWDTLEREAYNIRNDRLGAFYGRYVKSLNPSLIITRDGDEGTWGHKGKWQESPPCDTANYHYPDFNLDGFVINWQSIYDFRPVVFGETLYCSYGAWDNWIGAIPSQVAKKAAQVRKVATIYRELGIPAQIYMGLSSDGFIGKDNTGKGNPWGVTVDMENQKQPLPPTVPLYPWMKAAWPSQSGPVLKMPAVSVGMRAYGWKLINWFDPNFPSHVRNAVNDAYRDSLIPQPPLPPAADAECIIELGDAGRGKTVTAVPVGQFGPSVAITADAVGTAWFHLPRPGKYQFSCNGKSTTVILSGRADYAAKPGFRQIPRHQLSLK